MPFSLPSASWSEEMSALYGKSIGEEARYREKDVLLEPGRFVACIGASSEDIRHRIGFEVK